MPGAEKSKSALSRYIFQPLPVSWTSSYLSNYTSKHFPLFKYGQMFFIHILQLQGDFQKIVQVIIAKTPSSRATLESSVTKITSDWPQFAKTLYDVIKKCSNSGVINFIFTHCQNISAGQIKNCTKSETV